MFKWIDAFLDQITMYRLLLYYLIGLLGVALALALSGVLPFSPIDLAFCSALLVAVCWLSNKVLAFVFKAPTNPESSLITALILALIITPGHTVHDVTFVTIAGVLAMTSKYVLAIKGRHLFNPAAVAVVLTAYAAGNSASWWIGTAAMLPFVVIGGVLLVRRIRRVAMVSWFIGVALLSGALLALWGGSDPLLIVQKEFLNSALVFAGCVMLTEPLTSPTTKNRQVWYAVLVGVLFPPQLHIGEVYSSPELVLLIGNVFSYAVSPRVRTLLHLKKRVQISHDSEELVFTPAKPFSFTPGQYMEFTLPHKNTDARGARRYFTIASSPTEPELRLGVKYYEPGSSFKKALKTLDAQTSIVAAQLGGDFTLPKDSRQKVVFIAGGIGITPYRSMLKYMIDTQQKRPVTLVYAARTPEDIVWKDVLETAQAQLGTTLLYATNGERVDSEYIKKHIPDYGTCLFYISGPHGLVVAVEGALRKLGLPRTQIKKDFFSGYA